MALTQDNKDEFNYTPDDPALIDAVIMAESSNNPLAVGPVTERYGTAKGLMQIIDSTFSRYAEPGEDVFDPKANKRVGTKYLKEQYNRFGDIKLALAAYNWGPENVKKAINKYNTNDWDELVTKLQNNADSPPFETFKYVPKVLGEYEKTLKKKDSFSDDDDIKPSDLDPSYYARAPKKEAQGIGTAREFADDYYEVAADPDYNTLSFNEKMEKLSSIYNSRKWDEETFDVVKQISDFAQSGAAPDELPNIASIVNMVAGPPPDIEDGDTNPEKTLSNWQESVYSNLWENNLNPAYFGSSLNKYLSEVSKSILSDYERKNRGIFGSIAHYAGEGIKGLGRGAIRGYTDPVSGLTRLAGAKEGADVISEIPEMALKPAYDYLYKTNSDGTLATDEYGNPIPGVVNTLLEGFGQLGSFLVGAAALKALRVGSKVLIGTMGGYNAFAIAEQTYQEAIQEGATEEQAMNAALLGLPIGALSAVGSYAIVTGKYGVAPAVKGLSVFNRARVLTPYMLKNAAAGFRVEGFTEGLEQLGQSAAVSSQVDRNVITAEKVGTAALIGGVVGGAFKGGESFIAPNYAVPEPRISVEPPTVRQQTLPAPAERKGLPAPPERVQLPGREQRKGLPGFNITEGAEAPIQLYEPLSPEEQVDIGTKLEDFQRSDADILNLTAEQAQAITPEILSALKMTVTPLENGKVSVGKDTTHVPVDSEQVTDINNLIQGLQQKLENTPSPDSVPALVEERASLKKHLETLSKDFEQSMVRATKERSKLQRSMDEAKIQYEEQTDEELKQVARLELQEAEDALVAFDKNNEGVYNAWQKLAPIDEKITKITGQLKLALDPSTPYANDISAIQKNIKDLIQKRKNLQVKEANATAQKLKQEADDVTAAKEEALSKLGVEPTGKIPDISQGLNVEGHKIIPYNGKWYTFDSNNNSLGRGYDYIYDAVQAIKSNKDVVYSQKPKRPGFIVKEPIPERTALSPETVKNIEERVAKTELNKAEAAKMSKKLYEEAYRKQVVADKKRAAAERKATTKQKGKKTKKKSGVSEPTVSQAISESATEEGFVNNNIESEAEPIVERIVSPGKEPRQRVRKTIPKRPYTSDYTSEVVFAQDGDKIIRPREVFKQGTKLARKLKRPFEFFFGGAMPKQTWGFLNYLKNYAKVGEHNDIATFLHELFHGIDRAVIGNWDLNGYGDYSKLPEKVKIDAKDMYYRLYGGEGQPEHTQIAEGLALFFQHYASGQRFLPSIGDWYHNQFAKDQPQIYKALEDIKATTFNYLNQGAFETVGAQIEEPQSKFKRIFKNFSFTDYWRVIHDRRIKIKKISPELYRRIHAQEKRAIGLVENAIRGVPVGLYNDTIGIPNLETLLNPAEEMYHKLVGYLVSKRAVELEKQGVESGFPEETRQIINEIEKDPEGIYGGVRQAAAGWYRWVEKVYNPMLRQTSKRWQYLIDKIQQDNIKNTGFAHGFWVPFQRVDAGIINSFKKSTGSTRSIIDPLTQIQDLFTRQLDAGIRQSSLEYLATIASDTSPNVIGTYVREIKAGSERIGLEKELDKRVVEYFGEEAAGDSDARYMAALFDPMLPNIRGKDFGTFMIMDGKKLRFFEVPPWLNKALDDSLPRLVSNPFYDLFLRNPARLFRPLATSWRLAFQRKQIQRDPINAWKYLETEGLDAKGLVGSYAYTLMGIQDAALYLTGKKKQGSFFGLMDRLGLATFSQLGTERILFNEDQPGFTAKTTKKAIDATGMSLSKLEQTLSIPELGARVGAMRRALENIGYTDPDQPMTPEQFFTAASAARWSTNNYFVQGSLARIFNLSVPFLTANITELTRIPTDIKRNPSRMLWYGLNTAIVGFLYGIAHKDEEWYQELNPEAKMQNIWFNFKVGGVDKLFNWPIDTYGSMFWGLSQAFANAYNKTENGWEEMTDFAKALFHTSSPIDSIHQLGGVIYKEAISQAYNWDSYFEKPIEPPGLESRPPAERYNEYTTEAAKTIGKYSNISPNRIDHAMRALAPAVVGGLKEAEKVLGIKKRRGDEAYGLLFNAFTRSGTAQGIVDKSQKKFTKYLVEYKENSFIENKEEGKVRHTLNKINKIIGDYNTYIYGIDDQELIDELRVDKRNWLRLGINIAEGKAPPRIKNNPIKNQVKQIRKERKKEEQGRAVTQTGEKKGLFVNRR